MKASWNGQVIAESDDTVVVDGNHYFPAESLAPGVIQPSETTSLCGWKGTASYYTLDVHGERNVDAAWYYPTPKPEAQNLAGRVAFW
jgi:uncharacterized protein (DUF427 family)